MNANSHTLIVGGGAAGLLSAIFASSAMGKGFVTVLERKQSVGRKILLSGGGRCNLLPSVASNDLYHTSSPNTFKKVFASWSLDEQREFFTKRLRIQCKVEEETGKVFPESNSAQDIVRALSSEATRCGAEFATNCSVADIAPSTANDPSRRWAVTLEDGRTLHSKNVIVTTGGLSVPGTGSDGTGLRILGKLGHKVQPTFPALAPILSKNKAHSELAGLSLPVTVHAPLGNSIKKGIAAKGGFLFTHRGYSGPSVLNVSHTLHTVGTSQDLRVQWCDLDAAKWDDAFLTTAKDSPNTLVRTCIHHRGLPERLATLLISEAGLPADTRCCDLTKVQRKKLVDLLTAYSMPHDGDEGYKKAEVTGGGVDLSEINPSTMESRLHPGLFLAGECLDVWGPIGGYNFAWAWASGRLAGLHWIIRTMLKPPLTPCCS